jgi:hypothetical protein
MCVGSRLLLAMVSGVLLLPAGTQADDLVRVEVKQKRLVPLCLDSAPVPAGGSAHGG